MPTAEPTDVPTVEAVATVESPRACTAEELLYFAKVNEIVLPLGEAISELGALSAQAGENPLLFFDDDWTLQVAFSLIYMDVGSEELLELEAPTGRTEGFHDIIVLMAEAVALTVDFYTVGVDELDEDKIEEATAQLGLVAVYATDAANIRESVCAA